MKWNLGFYRVSRDEISCLSPVNYSTIISNVWVRRVKQDFAHESCQSFLPPRP